MYSLIDEDIGKNLILNMVKSSVADFRLSVSLRLTSNKTGTTGQRKTKTAATGAVT